jgi:hypothetical protein
MNFGYEDRFVRISAEQGLTLSICTQCQDRVAMSPQPELLIIPEKAHNCKTSRSGNRVSRKPGLTKRLPKPQVE